MSGRRTPFVIVCIDGHNAVDMSRTVHALLDIPAVGRDMPADNPLPHLYMMREMCRMVDFLPSLVVSPSIATYANQNLPLLDRVNLEAIYPKERTVFINLARNISSEIKTEGIHNLRAVLGPEFTKQSRQIEVSRCLGQMGYRAKTIDDLGGVMDIAHLILDEIRLTQRRVLEIEKGRRQSES